MNIRNYKPLATTAAGSAVGIMASRATDRALPANTPGYQLAKFFAGSFLLLAVASRRPTPFVAGIGAGYLGDTALQIMKAMKP